MGKTHQVPIDSSIQTYGHSGDLVKHKNIRKGLVRRGAWGQRDENNPNSSIHGWDCQNQFNKKHFK